MRKIAGRIKVLRAEKKMTILELGKAVNVSDATICRWENGISDIKSDQLIALAKFFEVITDYLVGLVD